MKSNDAPQKQATPFGANGPREPITPTTPSGSNQASYDQGFPPITMTLKSAGGLPPKGQDMNQILFEQSSFNRYFSAGGGYVYDSAFSTAIGGYPIGARIPNSTGSGYWMNTVQDNTANPENSNASLTGWVPSDSYGTTAITGLSGSSLTLTALQASKERIVLTGSLSANISLTVPAWRKKWTIVNNCTGAFSVTVKTPTGSGVSVPSAFTAHVVGDGNDVILDSSILGYSGRLLSIQTFLSSGTYTPSPGTTKIKVIVTAAGGSGEFVLNAARGAGGGAGGTAIKLLPITLASYAITVGLGTPTAGGSSSFSTIVSATGGSPGVSGTGGAGGVGSGGDINLNGGYGSDSPGSGFSGGSGDGGASFWGGGYRSANGSASAFPTAGAFGGGGGGNASQSSVVGRAGAYGVVVIEEYS